MGCRRGGVGDNGPRNFTGQWDVGRVIEMMSAQIRPQRRILLAATMRNEGPYILEWVAYHLAIGFTDLAICTNDCVDASPALLERLEELRLVTHLANPVVPA